MPRRSAPSRMSSLILRRTRAERRRLPRTIPQTNYGRGFPRPSHSDLARRTRLRRARLLARSLQASLRVALRLRRVGSRAAAPARFKRHFASPYGFADRRRDAPPPLAFGFAVAGSLRSPPPSRSPARCARLRLRGRRLAPLASGFAVAGALRSPSLACGFAVAGSLRRLRSPAASQSPARSARLRVRRSASRCAASARLRLRSRRLAPLAFGFADRRRDAPPPPLPPRSRARTFALNSSHAMPLLP